MRRMSEDVGIFEKAVLIVARDGYELSGTHFAPPGDSGRVAAVFACGGGIPARRYRHFLRSLAAAGLPVLSFDYRGVGASRPASLRGFRASVEDWAEFDCGAALDWLFQYYPNADLFGITHSFGATILTAAPGAERLTKIGMIVPHTGYWGDYRAAFRWPMTLVWHAFMPIMTHIFGYFPGSKLKLGDDIPAGVAMQWAARRTPEFRPRGTELEVVRANALLKRRNLLSLPVLVVAVSGDAFATETGIRRVLSTLPLARPKWWNVTSSAGNKTTMGHFSFFSRRMRETLWPAFLARMMLLDDVRVNESAACPPLRNEENRLAR